MKKLSKKNILVTSLAVTLAAVLLIGGGTLAYLQDQTALVENGFNGNHVYVSIDESTGDIYEIVPGTTTGKDPTVTVDNTVDAYVYVEVVDTTAGLVDYTIADGWTKLDGYDNVYYREVAAEATEKSFNVLANDEISFDASLTNEDMKDKEDLKLTFKAMAIQKAPWNDAAKAYKDQFFVDVWDSAVADKLEEVEGVYTINSAAELAKFADMVNKGTSFSGQTVALAVDIDLNNVEWTPIGQTGGSYAQSYFQGTFDGQGHTIRNLKISKTNDGEHYAAGLFGFVDAAAATIKNLNVDNASIAGHHWTGVIAGYITGEISNCTVTNSIVTCTWANEEAGGDKVGAIAGYVNSNSIGIKDCTVSNTTVSGVRDCGGIVGYTNAPLTGNTVKDSTIIYTTDNTAQIGGIFTGKRTEDKADNTNTSSNVTVTFATTAGTVGELKTALEKVAAAGAGDNTVSVTGDLDLNGAEWTPITVDGYHGAGVVTIEGNGNTITGLTAPLFAGGFAGESGIVIKDLTIADSTIVSKNEQGSGAFVECIDSMAMITLENCHLVNSSVSGSRTGGLIGWTAGYNNVNDGPVKTYITIKDCSVADCKITGTGTTGGIIGQAGANAWTYHTITNCTVKGNTITTENPEKGVGTIVGTANVGEITVSDCTVSNNNISNVCGRLALGETGKLTVDGESITG